MLVVFLAKVALFEVPDAVFYVHHVNNKRNKSSCQKFKTVSCT